MNQDQIKILIERCRDVPSDFHLQPTHFFIATEEELKKKLCRACLGQQALLQAPVVVVFSASRRVISEQYEEIRDSELEAGLLSVEGADQRDETVKMLFGTGPCFLGWFVKFFIAPVLRFFTVMPKFYAVRKREWLIGEASRSATRFWSLCTEANIGVNWISVYDELRVKRALGLPVRHVVAAVLCVGMPSTNTKIEKSIDRVCHWNSW